MISFIPVTYLQLFIINLFYNRASQQKVESDTSVIPYTDSDDSVSDSLREQYKGYRRKKGA